MTDDLISRADAIKAVHTYFKSVINEMPTKESEYGEVVDGDWESLLTYNKNLSEIIKSLPSAQPKQGKWVAKTENYHSHWVCSICGGWALLEYNEQMCLSNFCPNCGADMREREGE